MITKELQTSLLAALAEARKRRHEYLCLEHILYSLTNEQTGSRILRACGADLSLLRRELEQTLAIQRVLQRAILHMHSAGKTEIDSGNVLVAMFREPDSFAIYLLAK